MKQNLWFLNSSLLIAFIVIISLNLFLKQETPVIQKKITPKSEEIVEKKMDAEVDAEEIYKKDIFGTYSPVPKPEPRPKDLDTPIPKYTPPQIKPIPPQPKPEFIEPLKITISGIITSTENKSIAMIIDETNKEKTYRLGDNIKDGQIIQISKNKVVMLRANGQQEVFLLRPEKIPGELVPEKWKYIVNKIDENSFILNPKEFIKKIESIGQLMEEFSIMPSYGKGKIVGMRIGSDETSNVFGFKKGDTILTINGVSTSSMKDRIKIYDKLTKADIGDTIKINIKRDNQNITILYEFKKIKKPKKRVFVESASAKTNKQAEAEPKTSEKLKLGRIQKKEKRIREFEKAHQVPKQQDVISDIRQRIIENMKSRSQNRRIRQN